jgi:hypothetical protein
MKQTIVSPQELAITVTNNMQWTERNFTCHYNGIIEWIDEENKVRAQIVKERSGNVHYLWK